MRHNDEERDEGKRDEEKPDVKRDIAAAPVPIPHSPGPTVPGESNARAVRNPAPPPAARRDQGEAESPVPEPGETNERASRVEKPEQGLPEKPDRPGKPDHELPEGGVLPKKRE
jgi:hypothetical protein